MGQCSVVPIVRRFSLIGLVAALALVMLPALGRDVDGRYKDAPLHEWFNHLASQKGLCCSFADGYVVEDADWMSENGPLSGARAEGRRLQRYDLGRSPGRGRHH